MENYAKVKLRPSTFKTSQGFLKNHIKPQIGSILLADLTSLDLQRFYKHLLDGGRVDRIEAKKKPKGLAPKTVRNIHQMIGSAYNLAMPRTARRMPKGLFSTVENSPFETPRERKGLTPLDPRTAHIKLPSQQPCVRFFLLNDLACSSFRSAAAAEVVRTYSNFLYRYCGSGAGRRQISP